MKVFLGGTCNESDWRSEIIKLLKVDYFNPVVDDWTPEHMQEEIRQREECDVCLYTITPKMTGVYSIAEVVDDSNKRPSKTIFVMLREDGGHKFTDGQWKSLAAVATMVEDNGGVMFTSLQKAANHINNLPNRGPMQGASSLAASTFNGKVAANKTPAGILHMLEAILAEVQYYGNTEVCDAVIHELEKQGFRL